MPRLPITGQDENDWGAILNEFLEVAHRKDGVLKNVYEIANVRDYGALGDGTTDDTRAIQDAIDSGEHVYFATGTYRYANLTFSKDHQQVSFAPGAVMQPCKKASLISFSGKYQNISNLRISTDGIKPEDEDVFERLVKIDAPGCRFEGINILGPNVKEAVYLENLTGCVFVGGDIKGSSGATKLKESVGLRLGSQGDARTSSHEVKVFGLTIHHWETGILFTGESHDDPAFFGCSIENNSLYGVRYRPRLPLEQQGIIYNLSMLGCHFEGSEQNIYVDWNGVINGGSITGCRFGNKTKRVINAQGVLQGMLVTGCYLNTRHLYDSIPSGEFCHPDPNIRTNHPHIWEVQRKALNCADLFNTWEALPDCYFSIGNRGDRVVRICSEEADGETLKIKSRSVEVQSALRHQGDQLGFYGVEPVVRPIGYTGVPSNATPSEIAQALNQLIDDLKKLGLVT